MLSHFLEANWWSHKNYIICFGWGGLCQFRVWLIVGFESLPLWWLPMLNKDQSVLVSIWCTTSILDPKSIICVEIFHVLAVFMCLLLLLLFFSKFGLLNLLFQKYSIIICLSLSVLKLFRFNFRKILISYLRVNWMHSISGICLAYPTLWHLAIHILDPSLLIVFRWFINSRWWLALWGLFHHINKTNRLLATLLGSQQLLILFICLDSFLYGLRKTLKSWVCIVVVLLLVLAAELFSITKQRIVIQITLIKIAAVTLHDVLSWLDECAVLFKSRFSWKLLQHINFWIGVRVEIGRF